ncbi:bifunctional hydroxymethylpyrimidine kinase/phosphomethylpyrimidine kinase [Leucobacter luti]|uniref:bifunctional hydroxymethylpyrimidine kinase/phosphomethylpyrimidine kinase n=1 Tax=Leucobacter luti TaxID=340320 RepID=UPI003CFFC118
MTPNEQQTSQAVPRVLSIAGTDPTGGAGIQADLKSIAANGGYGMAAVTALVAQNTTGVRSIHTPPAAFLSEQLAAVSDDVEIDAVKIGMLFDEGVIDAVAAWLEAVRPPVVVLDPVMVATSGDRLLSAGAEERLRSLVGAADLVTPNIPELAALTGRPVARSWDEALAQGHELAQNAGVLVLVKGGHLEGAVAPDALVDAGGVLADFSAPRIRTRNTHGTGCSLSSAVATQRALGRSWEDSVRAAKAWLSDSIEAAGTLAVGRGNGPVSHFAGLWERGGIARPSAAEVALEWWDGIAPTRAAIDGLDFVRGLASGALDRDAFTWYLEQDALYLRDYSRVLAAASALAPTPGEQAFWASSANGAIAAELDLHASFLVRAGADGAGADSTKPARDPLFGAEPSAVTIAYVDHLLAAAARGSYAEIVAAVLPCFWLYVDTGSRLLDHATDDNPYASWLRTYGDPEFEGLNREAIRIVTECAAGADAATRARMRRAFEISARHELEFFAEPLRRLGSRVVRRR